MRRKALRKTLVRYAMIGIGVYLLCAAYQFVIWEKGPGIVNDMLSTMSFSGPDGYRQTKEYLYRELGLDRPFIPHLWLFDDLFIHDR